MSKKPLPLGVICEIPEKIVPAHCDYTGWAREKLHPYRVSSMGDQSWCQKNANRWRLRKKKHTWWSYARVKDITLFKSTADYQEIRPASPSASKLATFLLLETLVLQSLLSYTLFSHFEIIIDRFRIYYNHLVNSLTRTSAQLGFMTYLGARRNNHKSSESQKVRKLQRQTTGQANSRLWFRMRSWRNLLQNFSQMAWWPNPLRAPSGESVTLSNVVMNPLQERYMLPKQRLNSQTLAYPRQDYLEVPTLHS